MFMTILGAYVMIATILLYSERVAAKAHNTSNIPVESSKVDALFSTLNVAAGAPFYVGASSFSFPTFSSSASSIGGIPPPTTSPDISVATGGAVHADGYFQAYTYYTDNSNSNRNSSNHSNVTPSAPAIVSALRHSAAYGLLPLMMLQLVLLVPAIPFRHGYGASNADGENAERLPLVKYPKLWSTIEKMGMKKMKKPNGHTIWEICQDSSFWVILFILIVGSGSAVAFINNIAQHVVALRVRSAFFDRILHSRMPLDPTLVRLKRCHACDQWHSSRVFTPLAG
jgi:hypothetical protein